MPLNRMCVLQKLYLMLFLLDKWSELMICNRPSSKMPFSTQVRYVSHGLQLMVDGAFYFLLYRMILWTITENGNIFSNDLDTIRTPWSMRSAEISRSGNCPLVWSTSHSDESHWRKHNFVEDIHSFYDFVIYSLWLRPRNDENVVHIVVVNIRNSSRTSVTVSLQIVYY